MRRLKTKGIAIILSAALLLTQTAPAFAAKQSVQNSLESAAAYMLDVVPAPAVGSMGGEWALLGLVRSGEPLPKNYLQNYYETVEQYLKDCKGILHPYKYTEYSRLVLALTAIGAVPVDVAGYDLLSPLADYDKVIWQGVNGPIWAVIALDSGGYDLGTVREQYINHILSNQLSDGGWALSSEAVQAEADITAMALTALSKDLTRTDVNAAVEKGLSCLSHLQNSDGTFSSGGIATSESCAQVVVALGALNISMDDSRFVKNSTDPLEALLTFQTDDGGFRHTKSDKSANQMASEQGLYALAAADRAEEKKSPLFRMDDATTSAMRQSGLARKHQDVQIRPILAPLATFSDISGCESEKEIKALAIRKIVSGDGDGTFAPARTITRAEFSAMVVSALGLEPKANKVFSDISVNAWYAPYVDTAYRYGVVSGVGDGKFDPDGFITRQQAAVMVTNAARLCGLDTNLSQQKIDQILSVYSDRESISTWADASVAFCIQGGIMHIDDTAIHPAQAITRSEMAQMLYHLLDKAELL